MNVRPGRLPLPLLFLPLLLLLACGDAANTPLNAETRQRIDSTAAARIRLSRIELDSVCRQERTARLPVLVDSLRAERVREIEEKLRTVPR